MRPVATYTYRDATGLPLRRKLRFPPKEFAWQTHNLASDTWTWGSADPTSTLYNLHLIAADQPETVYCVEGEKDADTLTALGLIAVTSGNAGSWRRHHSAQLHDHGCKVAVVLPDHDDAGERHAFDVVRKNLGIGIPTKIVRLPGLADHEDVSDFIAHGGTRENLLTYTDNANLVTLTDLPAVDADSRSRSSNGHHRQHDALLIQLYREKLNLAPNARGQVKALCPFHVDANPSLSVDLNRLIWYCHGCCIGGGPVEFYLKWQGLNGRTMSRRCAWGRLKAT